MRKGQRRSTSGRLYARGFTEAIFGNLGMADICGYSGVPTRICARGRALSEIRIVRWSGLLPEVPSDRQCCGSLKELHFLACPVPTRHRTRAEWHQSVRLCTAHRGAHVREMPGCAVIRHGSTSAETLIAESSTDITLPMLGTENSWTPVRSRLPRRLRAGPDTSARYFW
jgi:hypothetical protein